MSSSPCPKNHPNKGKGKAPPYKKKTPVCWMCHEKGHIQRNCIWWSADQGKVAGAEGMCRRGSHISDCPYTHQFCEGCGQRYGHHQECSVDLYRSQLDYYDGSND